MRKVGLIAALLSLSIAARVTNNPTPTSTSGESPAAGIPDSSRLAAIKGRGKSICGVEGTIPDLALLIHPASILD